MHVVFRHDRDVVSKNPAGGADLERAAPKAGESSALALAMATATAKAFTPLRGASYFSLLVQRKDNQKKAHPIGLLILA